jgi:hypothetical protein
MTNVGGNPTRLAEVMRPMPNFPNRVSALEGEVTTAGGGAADAVAVRKARTGGTVRVAPPPPVSSADTNGAGHGSVGENVPTMGLADLLGNNPGSAPAPGAPGGPSGSGMGLEDLLAGVSPTTPGPAQPGVGAGGLVDHMSPLSGPTNGYALGPNASVALVDDLSGLGTGAPSAARTGPASPGHNAASNQVPPSVDLAECLNKLVRVSQSPRSASLIGPITLPCLLILWSTVFPIPHTIEYSIPFPIPDIHVTTD